MNAHIVTREELVRAFEQWRKDGPSAVEQLCEPDVNYGERCADHLLALIEKNKATAP